VVIPVPDGFIEHALQVSLRQGRTFEVLLGLDLPAARQALFVLHGRRAHLSHALLGCLVIPQIQLGADKDDGDAGGVVFDFRCPLRLLAIVVMWVQMHTLALTLSKDALLTIEKQMRKTSVWGYDSGLRRS
jgi:hypothetical protein